MNIRKRTQDKGAVRKFLFQNGRANGNSVEITQPYVFMARRLNGCRNLKEGSRGLKEGGDAAVPHQVTSTCRVKLRRPVDSVTFCRSGGGLAMARRAKEKNHRVARSRFWKDSGRKEKPAISLQKSKEETTRQTTLEETRFAITLRDRRTWGGGSSPSQRPLEDAGMNLGTSRGL